MQLFPQVLKLEARHFSDERKYSISKQSCGSSVEDYKVKCHHQLSESIPEKTDEDISEALEVLAQVEVNELFSQWVGVRFTRYIQIVPFSLSVQ